MINGKAAEKLSSNRLTRYATLVFAFTLVAVSLINDCTIPTENGRHCTTYLCQKTVSTTARRIFDFTQL